MSAITESTVDVGRRRLEHGRPRQARDAARRWHCVCGHRYRIAGVDRHRIYWPVDAPPGEPVLDGCCVRCRRGLPGKQPHCAGGT